MLHSAAAAIRGEAGISGNLEIPMATQTAAQHELAELIVTSLNLESVQPAEIDPDAPLFGGDLCLEPFVVSEIALAVPKRHGSHIKRDNPRNCSISTSLASDRKGVVLG